MKQNNIDRIYNFVKITLLLLIIFPVLIWIGKTIGESKLRELVHEQKNRQTLTKESIPFKVSSKSQISNAKITHGIDVSHYQGIINWKKVKEHDLGFVLVKATGGDNYTDPHFHSNWNGIRESGIIRGAYHFFYASDDPKKQARHFMSTVGKLGIYDLPPVLDVEISDHSPSKKLLKSVLTWLQIVEKGLKRRPLIYTDLSFGKGYLSDARLNKYNLWIATYEKKVTAVPSP